MLRNSLPRAIKKSIREGNFYFANVKQFNFSKKCRNNWEIRADWENNIITLFIQHISIFNNISLRASYHPDIIIRSIIIILQKKSWPESRDSPNPKIKLMHCHRFSILNHMTRSITEK